MVLEARLISIFLFFMCTSCAATQTSESELITDQVALRGYLIELSNPDGQCLLKYTKAGKKAHKKLSISGPCYFTQNTSQKIKVFSYEDVKVLAILIVVGDPISIESRATWDLSKDEIYGEKAQGILIKEAGLFLSPKVLEGGVMCPKIGLDEKDFWYLAH